MTTVLVGIAFIVAIIIGTVIADMLATIGVYVLPSRRLEVHHTNINRKGDKTHE